MPMQALRLDQPNIQRDRLTECQFPFNSKISIIGQLNICMLRLEALFPRHVTSRLSSSVATIPAA